MKKPLFLQKTAIVSRPWLAAVFLFAALPLIAADSGSDIQYRYDNDNTTLILKNYPNLSQNLISGGIDGAPAENNRIILQGSGNLYVDVMDDYTIAGSGWKSMEIDGKEWLLAGVITLTGTSATTFHVVSGTHTIGGPLAGMGMVNAFMGSGPHATIDAGAALIIGSGGSVGSLSVGGVVNNGALVFARSGLTFGDIISGSGNIVQTTSTLTLTGSNSYTGGTHIEGGTIVATNPFAIGTGKLDFLASSCMLVMNLATPADVTFNNELVGNGRILINLGSAASVFKFGDGVGSQYAGTFQIEQGQLDLSGANGAAVLSNSTLYMGPGGGTPSILVGAGNKNIGNLYMGYRETNSVRTYSRNAGALVFDVDIANPSAPVGDSRLSVGNFTLISFGTLGSSGTIRLATTGTSPLAAPAVPTGSIFEQDDANIITQLVNVSGSVSVNAANLALVGAGNVVITNTQTRDMMQGANGVVAKATYDYGLTTGANNDGLYVNYGLRSLDIQSGKTLELRNSGTGGYSANALNVKLTGAGGLDVYATGAMLLNGVGSTYTGTTVVHSGVVVAGENNAFGKTSATRIKSGAHVDVNGRLLSVGRSLVTEAGSSINLNGGYLLIETQTTTDDTIFAPNSLAGSGTLRIAGTSPSKVIFEGDNPDFAAYLSVGVNNSQFQIVVKSADALGTGVIGPGWNSPMYYQNISGTVRINSVQPTSNAGFLVFQSSTVVMTGSLAGNTRLVNSDVTYGPTARMIGSGTVTVDADSTLRLGLINQVTVSTPLVFNGGSLDYVAPTRTETPRATINDLRGSGTIWTNANPNTGDSNITVFKKVTGNFELNIRMLEVAKTGEQIMPIYSSTIPDLESRITLANGQVESGVYVFKLVRGTADNIFMPDTDMMYLMNDESRVSRAAKAIASTAGVIGAEWHYSLDSVTKRMGDLRQEFRADSTIPKGNLWVRAGNQAIIAEESLCGAAFDEDYWMLNFGADKSFRAASATSFVGVFGGVGRVDRTFTNLGDGGSDSKNVGFYATWMADDGWFVDLVGKADLIKNKFHAISSDGSRIDASYDSEVLSASLEVGKQIFVGGGRHWWIEPAVQAAYASLQSDDYVTSTGIDVRINSGNAQQYRAQMRLGYYDKTAKFQPYVKAAAVYSTTSGSEIIADNRELKADFDGVRYEAGLGGSYLINRKNQVYLEYEYAHADTYQRKWSFNIGYRHAW